MDKPASSQDHYPSRIRIIHLVIVGFLSILNIFLVAKYVPEVMMFDRPDFPSDERSLWIGAILNILISYNFLGWVAGSLIAMLPISRWDYARRYVRISFNVLILIQGSIFAYGIYSLL